MSNATGGSMTNDTNTRTPAPQGDWVVALRADGSRVSLAECPIGLFLAESGELCLKTEYGNNEGRIDAYIVSSGEMFWGHAPQTIASQQAELVQPVALAPKEGAPAADLGRAVEAAEAAVYKRHERGFLIKPLVNPIDMRAALEAALPFLPAQAAPVQQPWPEPVVTNPDIPSPTGVPYIDSLLHRVLDAQQDINLAANEQMSQPLCDASVLLDEVEQTIRRMAGPGQATANRRNICDCELAHNGLGLTGRECDCPAGAQSAEPVADEDAADVEAATSALAEYERDGGVSLEQLEAELFGSPLLRLEQFIAAESADGGTDTVVSLCFLREIASALALSGAAPQAGEDAKPEQWSRMDVAKYLAARDGIILLDIAATVGPEDDANNWREYLGQADDLLAHLYTSPVAAPPVEGWRPPADDIFAGVDDPATTPDSQGGEDA